jgi:hypothetical protein
VDTPFRIAPAGVASRGQVGMNKARNECMPAFDIAIAHQTKHLAGNLGPAHALVQR